MRPALVINCGEKQESVEHVLCGSLARTRMSLQGLAYPTLEDTWRLDITTPARES